MIGRILGGNYEVMGALGEGGMATVYRGRRVSDGRPVAIKVLREQYAHDRGFVARFEREAQAVARLSHPHMVQVLDSGRDGDVHFIVMEYVEGEDLKTLLRREHILPEKRAREIGAQVCEVLAYAHAQGIVHRDIKPQNILLTVDGEVKVTDFGIARALASAAITETGTVLGSVQYLSPEQARGTTVGRSADLYALGVVLYEMVTGQLPFDGESPIAIALSHVHKAPPAPSGLVPGLPERVEGIISRALMKSSSDRYRSAGEMRADLLGETDLWRVPPAHRLMEDTPLTMVLPGGAVEAGAKAAPQSFAVTVGVVLVMVVGGLWGGWRVFTGYLPVPEGTLPHFVGPPPEAAQRAADSAQLTLQVSDQVYSSDAPLDTVVSQDQPAGKAVKRGRMINVAVSLGTEVVLVPDVERRTLLEARLLLEQARLRVGEQRETFDEQVKGGFVIEQDPQPGARVERNRAVNLVVRAGEPNQEVKLVVVDEAGVRTVLRRVLSPGTRISQSIRSRGYTIIQVYIQGRLVQEVRP